MALGMVPRIALYDSCSLFNIQGCNNCTLLLVWSPFFPTLVFSLGV
jgi:hypothetical protein